MRYLFVVAVLTAATAIPMSGPLSPGLWDVYLGRNTARPPYDPPDIGPWRLDPEFVYSIPGVTDNQRLNIGNRFRKLHDFWVSSLCLHFVLSSLGDRCGGKIKLR